MGYEGGGLMPSDWTFTYNGLTIGGDGSPYQITQLTGLHDSPEVRTSDQIRARAHGLFAGTDLLGGRSLMAQVEVVAAHPDETVWSDFSRALVPGQGDELPLVFQIPGVAGGISIEVGARVRRLSLPVDRSYFFGHGSAAVEFWATDPRIYSQAATTQSVSQASVSGTGLVFPITFPLSFGGAVTGGQFVATNAGEFAAPWTATIAGPIVNPVLENVTTGQAIAFTISVGAGETLVVSSLDRSVLLNGTASRYSSLVVGSSWWELAPGDNTVRLAGTSGSGSVSFTFRSAWV
jgi:hypothetical protein